MKFYFEKESFAEETKIAIKINLSHKKKTRKIHLIYAWLDLLHLLEQVLAVVQFIFHQY